MYTTNTLRKRISSSFRDPSGYLYLDNGILYRKINHVYQKTFKFFINSGLCDALISQELLIKHQQINENIIQPDLIPFISYPYEWCFSEMKDAALLTLEIQKIAMEYGMILKDASAYNIQFINGKPIFIDTLSFDIYKQGQAWEGYNQFCQHFLSPLALMVYRDVRLGQLLKMYIDGIPLDLASRLIPKTKLWQHIHLNAYAQSKFSNKKYEGNINKRTIDNIVSHLILTIKNMKWNSKGGWKDYEKEWNYNGSAVFNKMDIIRRCLLKIKPKMLMDLGANIGLYTRIATDMGIRTYSVDSDYSCVELCYKNGNCDLPLVMDLANPSPSIGWSNKERDSFIDRINVDCVMALAIIHHLLISNNVPMDDLAEFFASICQHLIIEFVPKQDSQVQKLLIHHNDFINYTQEQFENEFSKFFSIVNKIPISDTLRTIYIMRKHE